MTDAQLDAAIRSILDRYSVCLHYGASGPGGIRKYAVFAKGYGHIPGTAEQVTEPSTHAEAQDARRGLITSDIIDVIRGRDREHV